MISNAQAASHNFSRPRESMVKDQLERRGISDPLVLAAMRNVPRHIFVPDSALHARAYGDSPLPIGHGQTISQPYIVALMSEMLQAKPGMSILEIGTGSGYQAAILAAMGLLVFTVEHIRELYFGACEAFRKLNLHKIRTKLADGTLGWPEAAPYDRMIITAAGPVVPQPLVDQLSDPGMLIMPLGESREVQTLIKATKKDGKINIEHSDSKVVFVDLLGSHGQQTATSPR
jgi:protein-L-isoaspartate(D-aspartate) O-methyltransferase